LVVVTVFGVAVEPPLSVTCPPRSACTPAAEWVVTAATPPRVIIEGVAGVPDDVPVA
jgi:hypothetical protein